MTRWELITSDEYIKATIECIVLSRKSIKVIREELNSFMLGLRDELLTKEPDVQVSDTTMLPKDQKAD